MRRLRGKRIPGEIVLPVISRGRLEDLAAQPIAAWVGYNGQGKSAGAVSVAMQHLDAGREVYATVRLLDWRDPRPCQDDDCFSPQHGLPGHLAAHPLWRPMRDFRQLFDLRDCHVLWDEVTGVCDAREHASMPVQVANFLPQLRRRQVTLHWTTIDWSFADVRLRRLTWVAVWANAYWPTFSPGEIWARNRLFRYRAYDARGLADDVDLKTVEEMKALKRAYLYGPRSSVWRAYRSDDAVITTMGAQNERGMCLSCGGVMRPEPCRCGKPPRRARSVLDVVEG